MRDVVRALLLGVAYWAAGRLALLMAIPPGYATAVWPSAGIALVGVLVWGPRVAPGVALGSIAVNLATSLHGSAGLATSLSTTGLLGIGAALEAVIGAALIRRVIGFPNALDDGRDVVLFGVLGGPVACVTSATIGVTVLCAWGIVPWADYGFSWWTWWVGDTIGVLVFAPITVLWLDRQLDAGRRRRMPITALLLIGFVGVTVLFVKVSSWEARERRAEFERRAAPLGLALEARLVEHREIVVSLANLLVAAPHLDRSGFRSFAVGVMRDHPDVEALGWDPIVADADRERFEEAARRDGLTGFTFTELGPDGELIPAARRPSYVPVYYLEPAASHRRALGYDVASDPTRKAALAEADRTGAPSATRSIGLVQDGGDSAAVLLFAPAFGRPRDPATLRGYAVAVVHLDRLLDSAFRDLDRGGLDVRVLLEGDAEARSAPGAHELGWNQRLALGSRGLDLEIRPTDAYLTSHRGWQAWLVLAGGLLFVGLLEIVLLQTTGQTHRIAVAEERFRLAIEAAPTGMIMTDGEGRMVLVNQHAERLFGYSPGELVGQRIELLVPERFRAGHDHLRAGFLREPAARAMGVGRDLFGVRKDGAELPVEIGLTPIEGPHPGYVVSSIVDVTERRQVERQREELLARLRELNADLEARVEARTESLTATLKEREVLLKEVHHRVKNNLQVISSLINMQVRGLSDRASRAALEDCRGRVLSIALIHEKLYQSSDYARVPFSDYVRSLARNVFQATGTSHETVTLDLAIDDVEIAVDKAIPCGLVIHELISNALKHAFPGRRPGSLRVALVKLDDARLRLVVADDGVGMPGGFDVEASTSLGLRLVHTLAEQLAAQTEVTRRRGTSFALTFDAR